MTFKEKKTLLDLIDEFHWFDDGKRRELCVYVYLWDFDDLSKFFREKHSSLFDDDGIECYWKGSYVCIPEFDDILDYIGLSEEEINEMFEEESCGVC